ncbi:hypothetical protein BC830DRAFT_416459 [Chytriomyces sp. MP71]|nr:hypothetical protein BC830DRAFT_416459 [Chytriomyces sp. MP71]
MNTSLTTSDAPNFLIRSRSHYQLLHLLFFVKYSFVGRARMSRNLLNGTTKPYLSLSIHWVLCRPPPPPRKHDSDNPFDFVLYRKSTLHSLLFLQACLYFICQTGDESLFVQSQPSRSQSSRQSLPFRLLQEPVPPQVPPPLPKAWPSLVHFLLPNGGPMLSQKL